jgi:hypothetical protein
MVIGKTTIAIATIHIQHLINLMRADIQNRPQLHTQLGATSDDGCPHNVRVLQKYQLDCPCAESSPTHRIRESLGISLALSPLGLLKTWCEEWKKCYSNNDGEITNASNPMQMVLVVGHRSAKVADGHSISADEIQLMKCGKTPRGDDEAPLCIAQLSNGRVTCVTMSQSFDSQVLQRFWRLKIYTWQPEGEPKKNKMGQTYITRPKQRSRAIPYAALSVASVW